jgi:chromatin segregation and condensation protein Rec8/ScpA/Scc1 (kleisin family)
LATKEDLRCVEDRIAAKSQIEAIAISVEERGRDMVQHLLEYRSYKCAAEDVSRLRRMQVTFTATQVQSTVGEAKVRAGRHDVEKAFERRRELQKRRPKRFPEVPGLHYLAANHLAARGRGSSKIFIENKRDASLE